MRTRRRLLSVVAGTALGLGVVVATASPAWAISSHISPTSQGVDSGDAVQWTGTWGGGGPYTVTFVYGDASTNTVLTNTSATSHVFHHTFFSCVNTGYPQTQKVVHNANKATDHANTTVHGTGVC